MPLPTIASLRDFYAFEQHVKTCRAHRGLEMVPQWYEVPVFYFSNAVCVKLPGGTVSLGASTSGAGASSRGWRRIA